MADHRQIPATWLAHLEGEGARIDESGNIRFPADSSGDAMLAPLTHLASIRVEGDDATEFLDGQLSAAIHSLPDGRCVLTAWHDPKGRALTTFLILPDESGFTCLMPADLVEQVLPKLKMYVLRSHVDIQHRTDQVAIGLFAGQGSAPNGLPLEGEAGFRYWAGPESDAPGVWQAAREAGMTPAGPEAWRRHEILHAIPALNARASGLFLPQFLGLERLGGLSFKKGCYTGQEVIARTHYLGKVKQGLHTARCDRRAEPATVIRDSHDRKTGQVLDAVPENDNTWRLQLVLRDAEGPLYLDDTESTPVVTD